MQRKEILTNLTITKCTLNSIITHHNTNAQKYTKLEMWANAQRDGRLAEYRWRPLGLILGVYIVDIPPVATAVALISTTMWHKHT